jgi:hypothetical protein
LEEICCTELPLIKGRARIIVVDHFCNVHLILQNCSYTNINIPRGTLIDNIENSSQNKYIMTQEIVLDFAKMEQKLMLETSHYQQEFQLNTIQNSLARLKLKFAGI